MPRTLIITASANGAGSLSSHFADEYARAITGAPTDNTVDLVDLAQCPPPLLTRAFVAAAFTPPGKRDAAMRAELGWSDAMIDRLMAADRLVIASPMYNFGVPAALKAWFDQIIRPGETFASTGDPQSPYRGLVKLEQCILITVRGSFAFAPDGDLATMDHLGPHVEAMLALMGVDGVQTLDISGTDEDRAALPARIADMERQVRQAARP